MKLQVGLLGGALLALSAQFGFCLAQQEAPWVSQLDTETEWALGSQVFPEDALPLPGREWQHETKAEEELVGDESAEGLIYREAMKRELEAREKASKARASGKKLLGSSLAIAFVTFLIAFYIVIHFELGSKYWAKLPPVAHVANLFLLICFISAFTFFGALIYQAVIHSILGVQVVRRKFAEKKYNESKQRLAEEEAAAPSTAAEGN